MGGVGKSIFIQHDKSDAENSKKMNNDEHGFMSPNRAESPLATLVQDGSRKDGVSGESSHGIADDQPVMDTIPLEELGFTESQLHKLTSPSPVSHTNVSCEQSTSTPLRVEYSGINNLNEPSDSLPNDVDAVRRSPRKRKEAAVKKAHFIHVWDSGCGKNDGKATNTRVGKSVATSVGGSCKNIVFGRIPFTDNITVPINVSLASEFTEFFKKKRVDEEKVEPDYNFEVGYACNKDWFRKLKKPDTALNDEISSFTT